MQKRWTEDVIGCLRTGEHAEWWWSMSWELDFA
jgi:hypothetical protein